MGRVSTAQIRKMYATAREHNIDNDMLHTLVFNETGQEHISALSSYEAIKIIDKLTGKKSNNVHRPNRASPKQIWLIQQLEKELGWDSNPSRLKGFMKKYVKRDNIAWLTQKDASILIEALKKLQIREKKKASSL